LLGWESEPTHAEREIGLGIPPWFIMATRAHDRAPDLSRIVPEIYRPPHTGMESILFKKALFLSELQTYILSKVFIWLMFSFSDGVFS